ncbi:16846_t:CDS:2, partial [Racocetra persica]
DSTKMLLLHNDIKPDGSPYVMTYIDDKDVVKPKRIWQRYFGALEHSGALEHLGAL